MNPELPNERPSSLSRLAFTSLWFLAFAIPLENVMIPGVGLLGTVAGIIAAGLCVLAIVERGSIRPVRAGHIVLSVFVAWVAVSYLWSIDPAATLVQLAVYLRLLFMVWLIWQLCPEAKQQKRLLQGFVLGTAVAGLDTLHQFLRQNEAHYQRYAGAGLDPNDLGLVMALSIPIAYCFFIENEGRRIRWLYVAHLALAGATILLSASRGAMLAVAVALTIVPATAARLQRRQLAAIAVTAALMMAAALFVVPETSGQRLATIPEELTGGDLSGRSLIWAAGVELFREHPFLGVGAGAYVHGVRSSVAVPNVAHNTFLSVVAELGIVGLGLLCGLLAFLVVCAVELSWLAKRLWLVCLAVWIIGVQGLTWEMRKPTWWLFGMIVAQRGILRQTMTRPIVLPTLPLRGTARTQRFVVRAFQA
jgi:O-antigen ligase